MVATVSSTTSGLARVAAQARRGRAGAGPNNRNESRNKKPNRTDPMNCRKVRNRKESNRTGSFLKQPRSSSERNAPKERQSACGRTWQDTHCVCSLGLPQRTRAHRCTSTSHVVFLTNHSAVMICRRATEDAQAAASTATVTSTTLHTVPRMPVHLRNCTETGCSRQTHRASLRSIPADPVYNLRETKGDPRNGGLNIGQHEGLSM